MTAVPDAGGAPSPAGSSFFRTGSSQSAKHAALILMASNLLSGVLGLVRTKYINHIFGASPAIDAYNAAFQLPDMISYFLVGGVGSATLVTMLTRFREKGDVEGEDRTLSAVLNAMLAVLAVAIVLAEFLAPLYTRIMFPLFDPERAALCTKLTRLLLPGQIFFFAGGVFGARLLARKIFLYQAVTPLIYTLGIIVGAVTLSGRIGVYSLPVGVLLGVALGPGLLTAVGAFRNGLHYTPVLSLRHPAFLEWLRLNLPLMLGFTVGMADKWILAYFASADVGGISRLTVAKSLFNAPLGVIGAAAGAASLPFFASLHAQGREYDFSNSVGRSVSRLLAAGALVSAWMIALAPWLLDLFRGGKFHRGDAAETAQYFAIFAVTLGIWSAQGIYARAFYAAGNARTPLIAGTIITVLSLPVYWGLFQMIGTTGLSYASDIGMTAYTVALAVLLHRKRLVSLLDLEFGELGRAIVASVAAYGAAAVLVHLLPPVTSHNGDFWILAAGTVMWGVVAAGVLLLTKSKLPQQLLRRKA
ncbi:MAG TPA: lipid II flippase MurJ [Acidobacteriaceae bacterium]|jgi:putative peptidoglycan lipid II flippase